VVATPAVIASHPARGLAPDGARRVRAAGPGTIEPRRDRVVRLPRHRGFVLLHTLVLLLALASLVLGVQSLGVRQARSVAAQLRVQELEGRLESAAHELSFRLLERSSHDPGVVAALTKDLAIDGVQASVVLVDTLLDLNHAEADDILRLMRAAGVVQAEAVTQALLRRRPIQTFAALQGLGVDAPAVRCLLRFATLSSGLRQPLREEADRAPRDSPSPGSVGAPGGGSRTAGSAVVAQSTLNGRTFRYWIRHAAASAEGSELVVEVRITGRLEEPVHVLEWLWLAQEPARRC
jgi:hypothetical protein